MRKKTFFIQFDKFLTSFRECSHESSKTEIFCKVKAEFLENVSDTFQVIETIVSLVSIFT